MKNGAPYIVLECKCHSTRCEFVYFIFRDGKKSRRGWLVRCALTELAKNCAPDFINQVYKIILPLHKRECILR